MKMERSYKKRICYCFSLLCFIVVLIMLPDNSFSEPDVPGANTKIANPVPLDLVKKISSVKAEEVWGKGAVGDPIPLSNLEGDLIVYMVPYCIGKEKFPVYAEIFQGVKKGRELQELLKKSEMEKAKEMYLEMNHVKPSPAVAVEYDAEAHFRTPIEAIRPDGTPSRKIEFKKISKFAFEKAIGAQEFGTIFVSATYDSYPVLAYFHYLAPYYMNFDLTLDKAEKIIGQGASLTHIYFLGLEGMYFEFMNSGGQITLNGKTLEEVDLDDMKASRVSRDESRQHTALSLERKEKRKTDLLNAWENIRSETGEK